MPCGFEVSGICIQSPGTTVVYEGSSADICVACKAHLEAGGASFHETIEFAEPGYDSIITDEPVTDARLLTALVRGA